jgi:hypothetical protein
LEKVQSIMKVMSSNERTEILRTQIENPSPEDVLRAQMDVRQRKARSEKHNEMMARKLAKDSGENPDSVIRQMHELKKWAARPEALQALRRRINSKFHRA